MFNRPLFRRASSAVLTLASLSMLARDARAHHPMGGKTPTTFVEGLLSGIGHPLIGPDHLAFIVALGIAAALAPAGIRVIAAFIAASTLGVVLHMAALDIPLIEQMVALSVVVAGGLIAFSRGTWLRFWQPLAAVAGLFHGYAFGEAVIGADRAVIGAYLIGIAIIASLIAWATMKFTSRVLALQDVGTRHLRIAGLLLACIGGVMFASSYHPGLSECLTHAWV